MQDQARPLLGLAVDSPISNEAVGEAERYLGVLQRGLAGPPTPTLTPLLLL